MTTAVLEVQEVYKHEVHNVDELRWFFAHLNRFCEIAWDLDKFVGVYFGARYMEIKTPQELLDARNYILNKKRLEYEALLREGSIMVRINFKTS